MGTSVQEMPHRVATDCQDRAGIIYPFDVTQIEQHRELVNIYSGEYGKPDCNLHEAISTQYQEFEAALPGGFYDAIPRKGTRRLAQAPDSESINCELIYSRTLGVLNSGS